MQKRIKNGLDKVQASIVDIDQSSLFDIFIPKQLRLGKNEIKIRLINENTLLRNSEIKFDILDDYGNPLYYEISNIANSDNTRSIIVHIFEDDSVGGVILYIYGSLTATSDYLCKINLEINPILESDQEIKFATLPEISYSEIRIPALNSNVKNRVSNKNGNGSKFTQISPIIPSQLASSPFASEISETRQQIYAGTVSGNVATGSLLSIPMFSELGIVNSDSFIFSSSYKGGQIWVRNLNLEIPSDATITSSFYNQVYSASIIEVISTSSIQVFPPFQLKIEYQTSNGIRSKIYDRFVGEQNVTCSYFEALPISQSQFTQSYAAFDVIGLSPTVGKVGSIEVSYKNLSLVGNNYEPLGNFEVRSENALIDRNNIVFDVQSGIIERPLGEFTTGFEMYWQSSSLPNIISSNEVPNGILLRNNQTIALNSSYSPLSMPDAEWIVRFNYYSEPSQSAYAQCDVYISGSEILKLTNDEQLNFTPLQNNELGTHVGAINSNRGTAELTFRSLSKSKITPKIRSTSGLWTIGSLEMLPSDKNGLTPHSARILAPVTIPTGSELNFKINFVNPYGKVARGYEYELKNVFFSGSINNYLRVPNGTVTGSDQLTSSYDTRYEKLGTTPRISYNWPGPITAGTTPGIVWTNMPYLPVNWLNTNAFSSSTADSLYIGDFTEITEGRLFTSVTVPAGGISASLEVQYSLDGLTNWTRMVSASIGNVAGLKDSGWVGIPSESKTFCYIRLIGQGSDGAADPRFSPPCALFK